MKIRNLLLLSSIATIYLTSCGGSDTSTSSHTLKGAVIASKVKGVKVCESGTTNCAITDSNGRYTLTVYQLPVKLEIKIGQVTLGDVEVQSTQAEDTVITPLDIAEGNQKLAEKIGALIHAIGGDVSGSKQVLDLSNLEQHFQSLEVNNLEEALKSGKSLPPIRVGNRKIELVKEGEELKVKVEENGNTYEVSYNLNSVKEEEKEICNEINEEEAAQQETGTSESTTESSESAQQESETAQQESGTSESTTEPSESTQQESETNQQTEETTRTITIKGLAYDSEVSTGKATLMKVLSDGSLETIKEADIENGNFSLEVNEEDLEDDAKYLIKVVGKINGKDVKFVSTLGGGDSIKEKAQQDGKVDQEEVPELIVSNVSTADYLFLKSKYNLAELSPDQVEKLLAELKALSLEKRIALSAVIKAYLDKNAQTVGGINNLTDLIKKTLAKLNDDGKLTTSELKELFVTDDINKYVEAIGEVKGDEKLKKVILESAKETNADTVRNFLSGKTLYWNGKEGAPFYYAFTFNNDGTVTSRAYFYKFDTQRWEQMPNEISPITKWEVDSEGETHFWSSENVKYQFNILSMDNDGITGIATVEDDSQINWLSESALLYDRNTYSSLNDFVSNFTNCDMDRFFREIEENNGQVDSNTYEQVMSHCFMWGFEFDTGNKKLVFKYPVFDENGHFVETKTFEVGNYTVDTDKNIIKVTFNPVNYDEEGATYLFGNQDDSMKPVMYIKLVDSQLAQEAQNNNIQMYPAFDTSSSSSSSNRGDTTESEPSPEEGIPPSEFSEGSTPTEGTNTEPPTENPISQPSGEESETNTGEYQSESENYGLSSSTVTPQLGNVLIVMIPDNMKMLLHSSEEAVRKVTYDPFFMAVPPEGESVEGPTSPEETSSMDYETYVCENYIGDTSITFKNPDNSSEEVSVRCENKEVKITYQGQEIDVDDKGFLTSCPMFNNVQECTIAGVDDIGFTVCKVTNGNIDFNDCKYFVNEEKADSLVDF